MDHVAVALAPRVRHSFLCQKLLKRFHSRSFRKLEGVAVKRGDSTGSGGDVVVAYLMHLSLLFVFSLKSSLHMFLDNTLRVHYSGKDDSISSSVAEKYDVGFKV